MKRIIGRPDAEGVVWYIPKGDVRGTANGLPLRRMSWTAFEQDWIQLNQYVGEGRLGLEFCSGLGEFNFADYARHLIGKELERLKDVPVNSEIAAHTAIEAARQAGIEEGLAKAAAHGKHISPLTRGNASKGR